MSEQSRVEEQVPDVLEGERLDRFIAILADTTRAAAAAVVESGGVEVNGTPETTRGRKLKAGDRVVFTSLPRSLPAVPQPEEDVDYQVVAEDPDFLVIDKPAGLVVHPGAGHDGGTLVNGLLARYPELESVGQRDRPGIIHRLDVGTSGLMVVARTPRAYDALVAQMAERLAHRTYAAIVSGSVDSDTGQIDAPLGRSNRDRTKMAVASEGKPARTSYAVQQRYEQPFSATRLECRLDTGRTHQIRVHLSTIGHPVIGDLRYGGPKVDGLERPFLHAIRLRFRHPAGSEELDFRSDLPADLVSVQAAFA